MTKIPDALVHNAEKLAHDNPSDIVAIYNLDETCAWASPNHSSLLGYSNDEIIGSPWTQFVYTGDHDHSILAGNDAMLHGRSIEFGLRAVTKSKEQIPLRGRAWVTADPETGTAYMFFQARKSSY